ncbi:MAG: hypothetical protein B6245_17160 [Desulfobacteraceae bacterium 4572_88]|nr:MAG: hypothetical protein B6245_17160 [Desulfobacteraceae bacterium 4572_88]
MGRRRISFHQNILAFPPRAMKYPRHLAALENAKNALSAPVLSDILTPKSDTDSDGNQILRR